MVLANVILLSSPTEARLQTWIVITCLCAQLRLETTTATRNWASWDPLRRSGVSVFLLRAIHADTERAVYVCSLSYAVYIVPNFGHTVRRRAPDLLELLIPKHPLLI